MVCDKQEKSSTNIKERVLILILLEYGLRLDKEFDTIDFKTGLNPYSIGIWSATRYYEVAWIKIYAVLILILLEYGLRHLTGLLLSSSNNVLILILLEYGLRLSSIGDTTLS